MKRGGELCKSLNRYSKISLLHLLKEPYREVFMLRVFGDLSFKEIADVCDKSESWAKVTFYRAKNKLIEDLEGKI